MEPFVKLPAELIDLVAIELIAPSLFEALKFRLVGFAPP
jgi:hypothetical protein